MYQVTYNNNLRALRQLRLTPRKPHKVSFTFPSKSSSSSFLFRLLFNPIIILLWAIGCSFAGISLLRSAFTTNSAFEQRTRLEKEVELEMEQTKQLEQQLKEADTPLFKERIIREELGLQKPGETVLQLPSYTP